MAISDNTKNPVTPTPDVANTERLYTRDNSYNQEGKATGRGKFNWTEQGSVFGMGNGINAITGSLLVVDKTMRQVIDQRLQNLPFKVSIIAMDCRNHRDLPLDVMLVTVESDNVAVPVGIHPIVITDSKTSMGQYDAEFENIKVIADVKPCMVFDKDTVSYLNYFAKEHFKGRTVALAEGAVLYTDRIDVKSEEDISNVLVNSIGASIAAIRIATDGQSVDEITDINIAENKGDQVLVVQQEIGGTAVDEYMQPLRSDVTITTTAQDARRGNYGQSASVAKTYSIVTAQIDILPYYNSSVSSGGGIFRARRQETRNYNDRVQFAPNIIFSSITVSQDNSIGNILTALAIAVDVLDTDSWWAQALDPKNHPQNHMHSIAGLGHEVSLLNPKVPFAPIPVDSEEFTEDAFVDFMNDYFLPTPSYSIRVPMAGPGTWKMSAFIHAAQEGLDEAGHVNSHNARILRHAELLTNGNFMEIYRRNGGTGKVISTLPSRLALNGTYHNAQTNQTRPLSDVDRAFLLNMVDGKQEAMTLVTDWTKAQVEPNLTAVQRVGVQDEVVKRVLPHADVTSYDMILDIEGAFITSLHEAARLAGLTVERRAVLNNRYGNYMPVATYINDGIVSNLGATFTRARTVGQGNGSFGKW